MRVSRSPVPALCGLLAAFLALPVAGLAAEPTRAAGIQLAQSGPPVRLVPRKPSGGSTGRLPAERRGGIREERLGRVNPESVGVLDESGGGLGVRLWAGTPRASVVAMSQRLPSRYRSAALRDLARRLLLTRAAAPSGLIVGESLITHRIDRLYRMGALTGAAALAKLVPHSVSEPHLAALQINIAFLAGDTKRACEAVDRYLAEHDTLELQRANVICLALAKDTDKAMLALSLLREQNAIPGEAWERLVDAAAQGGDDKTKTKTKTKPVEVTTLKQPTPGYLALMAALKVALPEDAAETGDLAILRTIALSKDAPPALRLAAGEKAAAAGAVSGAELGRVYAAQPIEAGELDKAIALARESFDAKARARLFKAAAAEHNARKRAAILRATWTLARKHGGYEIAARVFAPFVADMAPGPKLRRFAPFAARALYTAGEVQLATTWYRLLLDERENSESAAQLWPIARLAAPEQILWDDGRLQHWARLQRRDGRSTAARRIAILQVLFRVTGDRDADTADWQALSPRLAAARHGGVIPRVWRGMRAAAVAQRRGETVLALLNGVEAGDLSNLDDVDLRLVLTSLRDVGLVTELRAVALEAALANRL